MVLSFRERSEILYGEERTGQGLSKQREAPEEREKEIWETVRQGNRERGREDEREKEEGREYTRE